MQWLTVTLALAALAVSAQAQWRKPSFCKGDDCPIYQRMAGLSGGSGENQIILVMLNKNLT